uniref:AlNc14C170G7972 protein n=1 Tax=Albugo laibachii Nc14 TaxID=890382 RepID=F0WNE5_9STRA|nr:AlNc14C170G7972 [Albugo laibachii Nc14]|eukprot:CCA22836.1 AlNc14C170G7972 [Albugo laibachii Nc14]
MDAGVTKNFKLRYRCDFAQWSLDLLERGDSAKKIDVITAAHNIVKAWDAVTPDTIWSCWLHTGIVDAPTPATLRQENEPKRVFSTAHLDALIQKLSLDDPLPADAFLAYDTDVE